MLKRIKIVSLLPSATEIICALGLEDQLVGVTHECDYPPSVQALPKVTHTLIPHNASSAEIDKLVREQLQTQTALYTLNLPILEQLQPDLLVTQALCDVCAVSEEEVMAAACTLPGSPQVLNLEPMTLDEVFQCMIAVGEATHTTRKAEQVVHHLTERVRSVQAKTEGIAPQNRPKVAFLEWVDPLFSGGHWNPALVDLAGGIDLLGFPEQPSRTVPWDVLVQSQPDILFIACCGFDTERTLLDIPILQNKHRWGSLSCVQNHAVYVTDGNAYFSRPGPRLVDGLEILAHTLHPHLVPLPAGLKAAHRVVG